MTNPIRGMIGWFDCWSGTKQAHNQPESTDLGRSIPYLFLHLSAFAVIWVGWSWTAVATCFALYVLRMFFVTGFYHRYFSHRTFKTSRFMQFVLAVLGGSCVQRGALWWAAHHRHHHQVSDEPGDVHSPVVYGFWRSHIGWIAQQSNYRTHVERIPDLAKYPELRFLDRFDTLIPVLFGVAVFGFGAALARWAPQLGTNGWQMLVWGFVISTIILHHCAFSINSLAHVFGYRRYETTDASRNSFLLAIITLGEGWHNNHHHYPATVRQGWHWWEIDVTYYGLTVMSWLGLIWDLKPVPAEARTMNLVKPRPKAPVESPKASTTVADAVAPVVEAVLPAPRPTAE